MQSLERGGGGINESLASETSHWIEGQECNSNNYRVQGVITRQQIPTLERCYWNPVSCYNQAVHLIKGERGYMHHPICSTLVSL